MTTRSTSSIKRIKEPHSKSAYKYAVDVVAGKIPACLYVRQACQRAIDDFNKKDWQYKFDEEKAGRICRFISLLPHVKGTLSGRRIELQPFQQFILTQVWGWVDQDGNRRFRRALVIIPRGNGKSTLSSGIALYMLSADSKQSDCYCAATTRDQARIVFNDAHRMAQLSPELCAKLGIEVRAHQLVIPSKNSRFQALSSESHGLDGLNISLAILDELAQHADARVFNAIITGAGKRLSSLIFSITTAGSNQLGPGFEQSEYLRTILNGTVQDDQMFGVIWTIDADDDWTEPTVWKKANPGWGVSVEPSYVSGIAHKAIQVGTERVAFLQKHLDVWTAADTAFLDMMVWSGRCCDPSLKIEDFYGETAWVALDLASKVDLSARVLLFRRFIDGEKHYYLFARAYVPEAAVNGNGVYAGWQMQDRLTVTPGEVTDFGYILNDLKNDCMNFDVKGIAVDPWQASWIMQQLLMEGAPVKEYRNNVATMSNPMKELQASIAAGRLHHDGDPVTGWCMGNLVAHYDQKSNVFPRKNLETQKIDVAVATIMAIGLELEEPEPLDVGIIFIPFT